MKTSSDLAGSVRELVAQGALGDGDAAALRVWNGDFSPLLIGEAARSSSPPA